MRRSVIIASRPGASWGVRGMRRFLALFEKKIEEGAPYNPSMSFEFHSYSLTTRQNSSKLGFVLAACSFLLAQMKELKKTNFIHFLAHSEKTKQKRGATPKAPDCHNHPAPSLTSSTSVTTRDSPNAFDSPLAAPEAVIRRGTYPPPNLLPTSG